MPQFGKEFDDPVTQAIYDHLSVNPTAGLFAVAHAVPEAISPAANGTSAANMVPFTPPADFSKAGRQENENDSLPPAPQGVSIDDNIREAEKDRDLFNTGADDNPIGSRLGLYALMYHHLNNHHEMDYKSRNPGKRDFGNANYGAVGSALGLTPYELHSGAGVEQIWDNHWSPEYGFPFLVAPFGDNEDDRKRVDQGIRYYDGDTKRKK